MKKILAGSAITGLLILLIMAAARAAVGGGDITFSVKGAADVTYSHEFHVAKAGQKCTDCHYKIFRMAKMQNQATMIDMQNGRSCGACHNGQKAFTVKANCTRCHK
jgi:c(7)-type cytochrome triheme protein